MEKTKNKPAKITNTVKAKRILNNLTKTTLIPANVFLKNDLIHKIIEITANNI